ncbi:hypothetical protein JCGZ_03605 [Jatropha curcas]|uniref:Uncharacterized protein n=1 Tax=Jatropha curcas TaxID=180498 RepID=A0A067JCN9_JATCU|nr:hypothetical protein JCGZ_03605 [Jatropha curcas]
MTKRKKIKSPWVPQRTKIKKRKKKKKKRKKMMMKTKILNAFCIMDNKLIDHRWLEAGSGSGPHGGRGRGRSTHGRGGTIPPSSLGTSRASSSAQPPMPPPLPSIPSSSTSFPGPAKSSPASQSLIALTSLEPRNKLNLVVGQWMHMGLPQEARDFYWEEFQKHFVWEEAITAMLKVAWEKLCTLWYADFTYRIRKSGKKQMYMSQEIWESWQKAWEDPAFKRKCEIFARNRRSEIGGDGAGPSRHTIGSISAI